MLTLKIEGKEFYDDSKQEFVYVKSCTLRMEHSLVSLSKWEAKYNVPFVDAKGKRTTAQVVDYFRFMTITRDVNPFVYYAMDEPTIKRINEYINAPMTATTIHDTTKPGPQPVITSELIYYWMISLGIPWECEKWHLNRLLTLIQVCNAKNSPPKKMGKAELAARNRALNEARRKKLNTRG